MSLDALLSNPFLRFFGLGADSISDVAEKRDWEIAMSWRGYRPEQDMKVVEDRLKAIVAQYGSAALGRNIDGVSHTYEDSLKSNAMAEDRVALARKASQALWERYFQLLVLAPILFIFLTYFILTESGLQGAHITFGAIIKQINNGSFFFAMATFAIIFRLLKNVGEKIRWILTAIALYGAVALVFIASGFDTKTLNLVVFVLILVVVVVGVYIVVPAMMGAAAASGRGLPFIGDTVDVRSKDGSFLVARFPRRHRARMNAIALLWIVLSVPTFYLSFVFKPLGRLGMSLMGVKTFDDLPKINSIFSGLTSGGADFGTGLYYKIFKSDSPEASALRNKGRAKADLAGSGAWVGKCEQEFVTHRQEYPKSVTLSDEVYTSAEMAFFQLRRYVSGVQAAQMIAHGGKLGSNSAKLAWFVFVDQADKSKNFGIKAVCVNFGQKVDESELISLIPVVWGHEGLKGPFGNIPDNGSEAAGFADAVNVGFVKEDALSPTQKQTYSAAVEWTRQYRSSHQAGALPKPLSDQLDKLLPH